ncbi:MAG: tetratricopeptide repeat protein, partial [Pyrinomonadaceae bacterium]
NQKNAPFFIARSIHAQYRPGVEAQPNVDKARQAIAAYQKVLEQEPNNDEAYNALVYLYRQIKDEDKERQFLEARARDGAPEKRAQALTVLASKQWNCSYQITEQKDVKSNATENGKTVIKYKKPAQVEDFEQAKKCTTEGLKLAEQAISLDSNSEQAWSFKTNLLLEMTKLAEMDGNTEAKTEYEKQYQAAQQRTQQLNDINKQKREEEEKAKAAKEAAS